MDLKTGLYNSEQEPKALNLCHVMCQLLLVLKQFANPKYGDYLHVLRKVMECWKKNAEQKNTNQTHFKS